MGRGIGKQGLVSAGCPVHTSEVWQFMRLIKEADISGQYLREVTAGLLLAFLTVVDQGACELAKAKTGIY